MMFSVLELISREIRKNKLPKVVLIDEGWSLLRSKEAENYILDFIKVSRKYNASIGFITQEIEDLLRSEGGRSILNTTSTKILLRQNSTNLELITKMLALNEKERDYLLRANKGEGLMISEQGRYEFMVSASPLMHSLITTDPNDKSAAFVPPKKESNAAPIIDLARGYYLEDELSDAQKGVLLSAGYVYHTSHIFAKSGSYRCMVLRQSNESAEHALMCWKIADEIRKRGGRPEVRATVDADVSVKVGGKIICFEVETGENMINLGNEYVKEKMAERKKECDRLVVVITNTRMKGKYERASGAEVLTRTEVEDAITKLFG